MLEVYRKLRTVDVERFGWVRTSLAESAQQLRLFRQLLSAYCYQVRGPGIDIHFYFN